PQRRVCSLDRRPRIPVEVLGEESLSRAEAEGSVCQHRLGYDAQPERLGEPVGSDLAVGKRPVREVPQGLLASSRLVHPGTAGGGPSQQGGVAGTRQKPVHVDEFDGGGHRKRLALGTVTESSSPVRRIVQSVSERSGGSLPGCRNWSVPGN